MMAIIPGSVAKIHHYRVLGITCNPLIVNAKVKTSDVRY